MNHPFFKLAGVTALAAGMAFGQAAPSQNPGPKAGHHRQMGAGPGMMLDRMAADLNLTDAQKQQAQSIFQSARESARPLHDQMKQSREALAAAVKNGASDAEIDRLAGALGPQMAQAAAMHAKTFARFYAILTPEQKQKLGDRFQHFMDGANAVRGRWQGRRQNAQPQVNQ
jgi:Spy/CpxP family protein refolding chaperone